MWFKRKRIKAQHFFNYFHTNIDVKAISASIPNDKLPFKADIGSISVDRIPAEVTEQLKFLDMAQYEIVKAINSMEEGEAKELKRIQWIDTLIEMFTVIGSTIDGGKSSTSKKKVNDELRRKNDLYDYFKINNYELLNVKKGDFNKEGLIIWPVALQDRLTIIHKAQIEMIRVIQSVEWPVKIIIADCGHNSEIDKNKESFKSELLAHVATKNVKIDSVTFLSEYYTNHPNGADILDKFTGLSSRLTISNLLAYNTKGGNYSERATKKIENRNTLKFIQPILCWSAVIYEAQMYTSIRERAKALVIAGQDEQPQWEFIFSSCSVLGGIFNPRLLNDKKSIIFQETEAKIFHSESHILGKIDEGNLAKWLFETFIVLSKYPETVKNLPFCSSCRGRNDCKACIFTKSSHGKLPTFVDKEGFVRFSWDIIEPN